MLLPWVHPHLTQSIHPQKGRQLLASQRIQRGELLLLDPPYALIPTPSRRPDPDHPELNTTNSNNHHPGVESEQTETDDKIPCSNPQCNRLTRPTTSSSPKCPNRCTADVRWCDPTCQEMDKSRHEFECLWLRKYTDSIRSKRGEYVFGMLWIIVRLLARRHAETTNTNNSVSDSTLNSERQSRTLTGNLSTFKSGWEAISSLCGTTETWSHAQVREWTVLVKKYLSSSSLGHGLSNAEILGLICQEEANSFGLYPRETGVNPPPPPAGSAVSGSGSGNKEDTAGTASKDRERDRDTGRGEQFGAAVYPRASIANHSCVPNVIHKPDKNGRMVFTAGRDIAAGEECCISYFDLSRVVGLHERREYLSGLFRFRCACARCVEEAETETEAEGGDGGQGQSDWDVLAGLEG
ncbi:hypothetical protein BJX61DRAFT_534018 [Aspergillus egyptiacus]|nr:hypothetical protein BJX61DRAFT_534018 [Aspergillus egyptiacus]